MTVTRFTALRHRRDGRSPGKTRQHRVKHEPVDEGALLRDITENIPGVVYQFKRSVDGQISIPYIGPGCLEYYGVSAEAVVSDAHELARMVHPEDRRQHRIDLARSMEELTPYRSEHRVVHPDASVHWMSVRSLPRKLPDGSVLWTGVAIDVTDQKLAEIERDRLGDQLTQARKLEMVGRLAGQGNRIKIPRTAHAPDSLNP